MGARVGSKSGVPVGCVVIAPFPDRAAAGRALAARLEHVRAETPVVVGLPRGGVPVAFEVAAALDAPLDVIVVHKLGAPGEPELAMGAIGEGGVRVLNRKVLRRAHVAPPELAAAESDARAALERTASHLRRGRPRTQLAGRTVIVVDDGVATGATARAACQVARAQGATGVVLATPVASQSWADRVGDVADEFVAVMQPKPFYAVGQFYADFSATTDEEVIACLGWAAGRA